MPQHFTVHESFWSLFPSATLGVIVARGLRHNQDVPAADADAIAALLAQARTRTRSST